MPAILAASFMLMPDDIACQNMARSSGVIGLLPFAMLMLCYRRPSA